MDSIEDLINPINLIGFIFIIISLITLKFPPKKINMFYGYRTNRSMKNQKTWDFAQLYSSKKMLLSGCLLLILGLIINMFSVTQTQLAITSIILISLSLFYTIFSTEKAIKNNF